MMFQKNTVFTCFPINLASGALVLVITVIADNKLMELCYLCYI